MGFLCFYKRIFFFILWELAGNVTLGFLVSILNDVCAWKIPSSSPQKCYCWVYFIWRREIWRDCSLTLQWGMYQSLYCVHRRQTHSDWMKLQRSFSLGISTGADKPGNGLPGEPEDFPWLEAVQTDWANPCQGWPGRRSCLWARQCSSQSPKNRSNPIF